MQDESPGTAPPPMQLAGYETIALVLQGGGALGAYQAGVYEILAESDYQPDWVAGISIGAINAAIIAGNAPADRAFAAENNTPAGGDIFIHGGPPRKVSVRDWTAGCIAVTDKEIEAIYAMVKPGTPIFIMP